MKTAILLACMMQTASPPADTTETATVIETTLDVLEDGLENSASLQEAIEYAAHRKIRLETASAEALRSIPGMSEMNVQRIIAWRSSGRSIEEPESLLRAGLDEHAVNMLLPFVTFDRAAPRTRPRIRTDLLQRWSRRLDLGKGYRKDEPSGYLGSPDALQWRIGVRIGEHIVTGITLDKDPGEPIRWQPGGGRFGADFAALHLSLDDRGPFERMVAGGYTVQAGEGLAAGQSAGGISSLRTASVDRILRPHTSSREHAYFRGLAMQSKPLYGVSVTGFVSYVPLDARVDTTSGIWSLASTGYHRTQTEYERRGQARERTAGGIAVFRQGSTYAGMLSLHTQHMLGVSRNMHSLSVFGGWAKPRWEGSFEFVPKERHRSLTVSFTPIENASVHVRMRKTTANGLRPHTRIGVNSRGESYRYAEWLAESHIRPFQAWTATVRVRERKRPLSLLPNARDRFVAGVIEYKRRNWFTLHVRALTQTSEAAARCPTGRLLLPCSTRERRQSLRIQFEYRHSPSLRSRTRIETVYAEAEEKAAGVLVYQDFRWKPRPLLQLDMRYALFDAADASARLYMFENDVLYGFGAPSFHGRGRRWYVLSRLEASRRLMVQLKFGATHYEDVRSTGSGRDEIPGGRVREMKVLARWRFGS